MGIPEAITSRAGALIEVTQVVTKGAGLKGGPLPFSPSWFPTYCIGSRKPRWQLAARKKVGLQPPPSLPR